MFLKQELLGLQATRTDSSEKPRKKTWEMSHHPLWKGDIGPLRTQEIGEHSDPIVFQAGPTTKDHGSFIESISAGREWA